LSIRANNAVQLYYIGDICFVGQSINKVVADKVISVSSNVVVRRIKDIIDLYILSYSWYGTTDMIYELAKYRGNPIESFDRFLHKKSELRHAYSKYINKAKVLDFDIVYARVSVFLKPFICSDKRRLLWNGGSWVAC